MCNIAEFNFDIYKTEGFKETIHRYQVLPHNFIIEQKMKYCWKKMKSMKDYMSC